MIKYHYYGLKGSYGYNTIAFSEGISDTLLINIKSAADRFSLNSGFSRQQMHMINDEGNKIIGNIIEFPPQTGEMRNSYFCQQYILDQQETEKYLLRLPRVISSLSFVTERSECYTTSSEELPIAMSSHETDVSRNNLKQLVQAAMEVILDAGVNRQVFIAADKWDKDFDSKSRKLIAKITEYLPLECRRRLGYVTYSNNIDGLTMLFKLVCCRNNDVIKFKDLYKNKNCYYYNADDGSIYPPIEVGSYVNFVFDNYGRIQDLISDCDKKLSNANRMDIKAYNAYCDIYEQVAFNNEEAYIRKRESILRNIPGFFNDKIIDKEYINNVFRTELSLLRRKAVIFDEEAFEIWSKQYKANLLSKQDIFEYIFINKQKYSTSVEDFITENGIRKEYYKYCISQQHYPEAVIDEVARNIRALGVLTFNPASAVNEWGSGILQAGRIRDVIMQGYTEEVERCAHDDIYLQNVNSKARELRRYGLDEIAFKIEKAVKPYLEKIYNDRLKEEEKLSWQREKERICSSLEARFAEYTIKSIADVDFISRAEKSGLMKAELDRVAEVCYKKGNFSTALLFQICSFEPGFDIYCDANKLENYFSANKKLGIDKQYQILLQIASLPDFNLYNSIRDALISYVKNNLKLRIYIKLIELRSGNSKCLSNLLKPQKPEKEDQILSPENNEDNVFNIPEPLTNTRELRKRKKTKETRKVKVLGDRRYNGNKKNDRKMGYRKYNESKKKDRYLFFIILLSIIFIGELIWMNKEYLVALMQK